MCIPISLGKSEVGREGETIGQLKELSWTKGGHGGCY